MSACEIDGCDAPRKARGWCTKHYQRWTRHGDTGTVTVQVKQPNAARRNRHVEKPHLPHTQKLVRALVAAGWHIMDVAGEAGLSPLEIVACRDGRYDLPESVTDALIELLTEDVPTLPSHVPSGPLLRLLRARAVEYGGVVGMLTVADRQAFGRAQESGRFTFNTADRLAVTYLDLPLELLYDLDTVEAA